MFKRKEPKKPEQSETPANAGLFSTSFAQYQSQLHSQRPAAVDGPAEIQKDLPQVQEIRWGRTWKSLGLILPPFIIVGLLSLYLATPLSKVRDVTVHGTNLVTNQAVINASALDGHDYIPKVYMHRSTIKKQILNKIPEIKRVKVDITAMRDVTMTVTEYAGIGYYHDRKGYHLILSTGQVLPDAIKSPKRGLPVFSGFGRGKRLAAIIKLVAQFPAAVAHDVSEVNWSRGGGNPYQITLTMNDGNKVVADQRTVLKKIPYYPSMVAQVKGFGTVDLEVGAYFTPRGKK